MLLGAYCQCWCFAFLLVMIVSTPVLQLSMLFTEECDKVRDLMHVHSFSYVTCYSVVFTGQTLKAKRRWMPKQNLMELCLPTALCCLQCHLVILQPVAVCLQCFSEGFSEGIASVKASFCFFSLQQSRRPPRRASTRCRTEPPWILQSAAVFSSFLKTEESKAEFF